tara:strand:- start:5160 stop:6494 length:1335 start_codon:yes stop_codon:yes gene_type:complete
MFVDDLAGKEIDFEIIFKFLIFYCPKLIPLVLPLTVLLASIMTFGDLAENYEFAAIKSSGISLFRSMKSLMYFNLFLCVVVYFVTNNLIPHSEFKSYNLRKNLAKVKPSLAITEGIFNDLGLMNIKVANKSGVDNSKLEDVIIHKINRNNDNTIVIKAKSGKLISDEKNDILRIKLNDGYRYEEILAENPNSKQYKPHTQIYFETHEIFIDLKQIYNVDFSEERYNNTFRMQNLKQLEFSIDSLENKLVKEYSNFGENFYRRTGVFNFQTKYNRPFEFNTINISTHKTILNDFDLQSQKSIINSAVNNVSNQIANLNTQKTNFFIREKIINLHKISYHDKYAIPVSTLILFILGAPLGAIIRKGGFGFPVVTALMMFLFYHFLGTFAKNAAEDGSVVPFIGSWISNFVMLPIALYLLKRASSDKSILNVDSIFEELKNKLIINK